MTAFFEWIFQSFLSPLGLLGLAALDSSMLFFLPAAVDSAVVILSARHSEMFWVFPLLATAGSLVGASVTFWIGGKIGGSGLEYWVSKERLARLRRKIKDKGAVAVAVPALMPAPFPLTAFILACGAFSVSRTRFFLTFSLMRLVRFGAVSVLGWIYGQKILSLFDSNIFKTIMASLILLAVVGSAYTVYRLVISTRSYRSRGRGSAAKNAA